MVSVCAAAGAGRECPASGFGSCPCVLSIIPLVLISVFPADVIESYILSLGVEYKKHNTILHVGYNCYRHDISCFFIATSDPGRVRKAAYSDFFR